MVPLMGYLGCAFLKYGLIAVIGLLLLGSGAAQAVDCGAKTEGSTTFTVCRVDLNTEHLELFWRDGLGRPYREFAALSEALKLKGEQLVFAANAGMYKEDFSPVGLFVAQGKEWVPLNHHVGSGNFSQQPNGVFLVEGHSARVLTTDDYAKEKPAPLLATQSGPMLVHAGEITTSAVMKPDSTWRKIRNGVCAIGALIWGRCWGWFSLARIRIADMLNGRVRLMH